MIESCNKLVFRKLKSQATSGVLVEKNKDRTKYPRKPKYATINLETQILTI